MNNEVCDRSGRYQKLDFQVTWNQPKNGFKRQVEQGFSSFFANFFLHIWWFFKVSQYLRCTPLWKIMKYAKNLAQNEEKPSSTGLNTYSGPENLKKSRPKKLVKSNKSISWIFFGQISFFAITKMAENQFLY